MLNETASKFHTAQIVFIIFVNPSNVKTFLTFISQLFLKLLRCESNFELFSLYSFKR